MFDKKTGEGRFAFAGLNHTQHAAIDNDLASGLEISIHIRPLRRIIHQSRTLRESIDQYVAS